MKQAMKLGILLFVVPTLTTILPLIAKTEILSGSAVQNWSAKVPPPKEIKMPRVFLGQSDAGEDCALIVETWTFSGMKTWYHLSAKIRASFQKMASPAMTVQKAATPFTLFGVDTKNQEQIAIQFSGLEPDPSAIVSYQFQSWEPGKGLLLNHCKELKEQKALNR